MPCSSVQELAVLRDTTFHLLLSQFVQVNQTLSLPSLLLQQAHVVFTSVFTRVTINPTAARVYTDLMRYPMCK